jgi:hypothetical protein
VAEIRVGKPDVKVDAAAHTRGVENGNGKNRQRGLHKDGTVDARFSTGIRPKRHNPVLPVMPNLPPG